MVDEFRVKPHHRDTEDTEIAQRNPCKTVTALATVNGNEIRDLCHSSEGEEKETMKYEEN